MGPRAWAERRRPGSAPWFDVGKPPPRPPRRERRGHAGAGRGHPGSPAAGGFLRAPDPPRAACRADFPPARGAPSGRASLPSAAIRLPSRDTPRLPGSGPGLPQSCRPGRCVGREPRRGRAGESEPGGRPGGAGGERARGSRGGVRACVSERARESEGSERAGARGVCVSD